MFKVIDTNNDAILGPDAERWNNCEFATLAEAIAYANDWLYNYGPLPADYKVGEQFVYSGCETGDAWVLIEEFEAAPLEVEEPKKVVAMAEAPRV